MKINLGLRRAFIWTFIIADVNTAIIGADFLAHYDLLVDLKRKRLLDQVTSLESPGSVQEAEHCNIRSFSLEVPYGDLLAEFPTLTATMPPGKGSSTTTVLHIITTGQPVSSRPR
uniref:Putative retrotransposable element n=1 Tax=Anopheles darlingi TaxID=43151 RepID=A0A2M4DAK5_ANODA